MRSKILSFVKNKNKKKITCLTAYSKTTAKILDKYCDLVLVGDSLANVLYGMKNTHNLSLDTIINHAKSVKLGIKRSLLVVDMPKGSYQTPNQAKKNAKIILKKTGCDAVKIENNINSIKIVKFLTKSKIDVMGHIGYTPQFKKNLKLRVKAKQSKKNWLNLLKKLKMLVLSQLFWSAFLKTPQIILPKN